MKIRKTNLKDVSLCVILARQEGETYWQKNDFVKALKDKNVEFIVAEEKGVILGYCIGFIVPTKNEEAMIHESRVSLSARGKKVGTKLVDFICKAFFKRKVKVIYAMIENKLKPFYLDSCKFKETGLWIEASMRK